MGTGWALFVFQYQPRTHPPGTRPVGNIQIVHAFEESQGRVLHCGFSPGDRGPPTPLASDGGEDLPRE